MRLNIRELGLLKTIIYKLFVKWRSAHERFCLAFFSESFISEQRLSAILSYANNHCKYYRRVLGEKGVQGELIGEIEKWPIVSKDEIASSYEDFLSDEIRSIIYRDSYTGGSTGEPFHFYNQMTCDGVYQNRLWRRMGYKRGDTILAMDGTKVSNEKVKKGVFWGTKSKKQLPYGGFFMSSLYLRNDNIHLYVNRLLELKPTFIRGYPFFIYTVAKYIQDNSYEVDFKMKGIELTSETSFPYQRQLIKDVFHTEVFMQYGHTECCAFAYTMGSDDYYRIEKTYGLIEILKRDGEPAKKGEIGEIVVTTYFNKVLPLIRYRTGDCAEVDWLENGEMILRNICGRTQDYIFDKMGNRIMITALIMAQHLEAMGHIIRWQIEQSQMGQIELHIIKGKGYTYKDEKELTELFMRNDIHEIVFNYVDALSVTSGGKSKLVLQHVRE